MRDARLKVYNDLCIENSFIFRTSETMFARADRIGSEWCVWFYKFHTQKNFPTLRRAMLAINDKFIGWYTGQ